MSADFSHAHAFSLRVYMEDTDAQGRVYYANYLKFSERARTEFLLASGISHADLMKQGQMFVVQGCRLTFHAPASLSEILVVKTQVSHIGGASFDLAQQVTRERDLIATLHVKLVCVTREDGRPFKIPDFIREILERDTVNKVL